MTDFYETWWRDLLNLVVDVDQCERGRLSTVLLISQIPGS